MQYLKECTNKEHSEKFFLRNENFEGEGAGGYNKLYVYIKKLWYTVLL